MRDYLMWLAARGVYAPRFSEDIHQEWMRSVLRDHPELSRERLERSRRLMDAIDPQGLVTGYESLIPTLSLPDKNDRHVLAAAITARASVIVTFNLSDFPQATMQAHGLLAQQP